MTGLAVGDELPPLTLRVTRADLVRYAGASGDFNPIHWSDRVAGGVGLPGVIAHGMLTMALAGRIVTDWAGPAAVRSYGVRFTRPVVVPDDDDGASVEVSGKVAGLAEAGGETIAKVAITATFEGRGVLGKAVAEVAVPAE
ncbi:dehydratase [Pseudonocardia sp. CNS-139]|nr:dehydratase [Pseudonocardia sp. CNS-139]